MSLFCQTVTIVDFEHLTANNANVLNTKILDERICIREVFHLLHFENATSML